MLCYDMSRKRKNEESDAENGFKQWGGYMAAKVSKLGQQFKLDAEHEKISDIFNGVAILVNGNTKPNAEELKKIMAQHGGQYHMYQLSSTTHIIASNLPNVKIKNLGTKPVVKPSWITESVALGRLIDFRRYLLYTNQSITQPRLDFPVIEKPLSSNIAKEVEINNEPFGDNKYTPAPQTSRVTKTASDPNFLEEFYNNSRLHLISTLGAEFKQLVGQMRDKHNGIFLGKEKLIATKDKQPNTNPPNKVIMHIDMDCFFVSVGLRNHPELRGKPVAVTHAKSGQTAANRSESWEAEFALYNQRLPEGAESRVHQIDGRASMSEIASCSYEARKCGVKNGMFLGTAVKLCPELKTLPYDFEGYKEVSNILYKSMASYTLDIEAVSCDEMYVDCTKILKDTGLSVLDWATHIRNEIVTITGCPCSTGFGANRLQARLATRKAKPAGQYYLETVNVEDYMSDIPLSDLPGVGRMTLAKLDNLGLTTCGDVQIASLKVLQSELGIKAGETLMDQARGEDKKPLNFYHERKSVSAEVNYGIRFKSIDECHNFLQSLSNEVYNRLVDTGMKARCLTLKLLVRAENAPIETAKFLGHGVCNSLTKSTTSNMLINDPNTIFKEAKTLFEKLNAPYADLRGVGIQLTKLEKLSNMNTALSKFLKKNSQEISTKNTSQANTNREEPKSELTMAPSSASKPDARGVTKSKRGRGRGRGRGATMNRTVQNNTINKIFEKKKQPTKGAPKKVDIDMSVLKELPEDIRNEIIKEYQLEKDVVAENPEAKKDEAIGTEDCKIAKSETNNSPFTNLSWEQIKPIIKNWIQSEETPELCDAEMIAEHFKQLAIDRKIETLLTVFNFLHRVFSSLDCLWHEAYYTIVNITQQGMVARYGGTLAVKRNFHCCEM